MQQQNGNIFPNLLFIAIPQTEMQYRCSIHWMHTSQTLQYILQVHCNYVGVYMQLHCFDHSRLAAYTVLDPTICPVYLQCVAIYRKCTTLCKLGSSVLQGTSSLFPVCVQYASSMCTVFSRHFKGV